MSKYDADESVSNKPFHLQGQELSQILKVIDPMIRKFCHNNPQRWVNISFSEDGQITSNIAISEE